jgi:hypothetical protein
MPATITTGALSWFSLIFTFARSTFPSLTICCTWYFNANSHPPVTPGCMLRTMSACIFPIFVSTKSATLLALAPLSAISFNCSLASTRFAGHCWPKRLASTA